jgi:hypothetical protein
MVLISIVIYKNNKYGQLESNPLFYSKKTSKMWCPKYPQNSIISGKSRISRNKKNWNFFKTCEIKLIICLSSHKNIGLVAICFAWEKFEFFWRIFFHEFCGHLEINLFLQWLTIYYRLFSMKKSSNILKHDSNPKNHITCWEKFKSIKWKIW